MGKVYYTKTETVQQVVEYTCDVPEEIIAKGKDDIIEYLESKGEEVYIGTIDPHEVLDVSGIFPESVDVLTGEITL